MGRRSKLSSEVSEEICLLIRKGCPVEVACRALGIARSTYYSWLSQGEEEEAARQKAAEQGPEISVREAEALTGLPAARLREAARTGGFRAKKQGGRWLLDRAGLLLWAEPEGSPYLQFLEAIRQAEAEAEAHLVELWQEQTPQDWKAARDLLSRRFPQRWSERRLIEANLQADARVQADVSQVSATVVQHVEEDVPIGKVRETLEKFRQFLKAEAVKAEVEQEGPDTVLEALAALGGRACLLDVARAAELSLEDAQRYLRFLVERGQVEGRQDGAFYTYYVVTQNGHDLDEEPEPPTPKLPPAEPWTPPSAPPSRRGPVVAGKIRDGE